MSKLEHKRILLKFSGESVAGNEKQGIDPKILDMDPNKPYSDGSNNNNNGNNVNKGPPCLLYTSPSPRDRG